MSQENHSSPPRKHENVSLKDAISHFRSLVTARVVDPERQRVMVRALEAAQHDIEQHSSAENIGIFGGIHNFVAVKAIEQLPNITNDATLIEDLSADLRTDLREISSSFWAAAEEGVLR